MHTTLTPAARLLSAVVAVVTTTLLFSGVISISGPDRAELMAHARQAAAVQVAAATPRDAKAAPATPARTPTTVALSAAPPVDAR
jgi:hypothetical protein